MRRLVAAALVAAAVAAAPAAAFAPSDPLAARQWYLTHDRAFDLWPELPLLPPVKVAVIDSGIDLGHPEFAGRIAAARSFVGGTVDDRIGHGTFVAGEIAAAVNNGQGIAGLAFPAQLVIAKVTRGDGTIAPAVEAAAIRWAVNEGARVVNLSIGGLRDPVDRRRDTFSRDEEAAIVYATAKGAVVVAAVGNNEVAAKPWEFASYPAALPHVIGVGALGRDGAVPGFSNRDRVFNDLVAPGVGILSTLPRALTAARPTCVEQGYSSCGSPDYEDASGTSFAAPQVSAAAALLLSVRPDLRPDQVSALLERSAADARPMTGCATCRAGRDATSGWGSLDVYSALVALEQGRVPPADALEPNDAAGRWAPKRYGPRARIRATIDYWDDPLDVYRVYLRRGQRFASRVVAGPGARIEPSLWHPRARAVVGRAPEVLANRVVLGTAGGSLAFTPRVEGWYYVVLRARARSAGTYVLDWAKT